MDGKLIIIILHIYLYVAIFIKLAFYIKKQPPRSFFRTWAAIYLMVYMYLGFPPSPLFIWFRFNTVFFPDTTNIFQYSLFTLLGISILILYYGLMLLINKNEVFRHEMMRYLNAWPEQIL